MNRELLMQKITQAFLSDNQNFDDCYANDEFLQKSLWARLDNNNFLWRFGKQTMNNQKPENLQFARNTELEVYKIVTLSPFETEEAVEEVAKTFYDIKKQSYSFRLLSSHLDIFSHYIKGLDLKNAQNDLIGENTTCIVEIYAGEDNALYLSFADDVLFVYFFTFFPNDEFLN